MRRWWLTIALGAISVGLVYVLAAGFGRNPREVPFLLAGTPAPAFNVQSLETGERITQEHVRGRPLVINFWASWCGPCEVEHPVLEWGARELSGHVQFMGVVVEDTEENAKAFLVKHGSGFPQMLDPNGRMATDYGLSGVPETYFVDAKGTIVTKHKGPIDPQTLASNVRRLLEIDPAPAANLGIAQ